MLALAAGDVTMSWSVIQWGVALALGAAAASSGVLVARALHGRALTQIEKWKTKTIAEDLPSRMKTVESTVQELKDAGLIGRMKDVERTGKETTEWRKEATQQLEDIERETYAEAKVKAALAESSTSRGTMPYRKATK